METGTYKPSAETERCEVPDAVLRRDRISEESEIRARYNPGTVNVLPPALTADADTGWERYADSRLKHFRLW